ncbi:MAG: cyclic nucleotide-binding domain-containing protein [Thermodesulfobacteriota bacterium]
MKKAAAALLAFLAGAALLGAPAFGQADAPALAKAINQASLFSGLTAAEKDALQTVAKLRHGKGGERIITQGSALDRMYIIPDGQVEVLVDGKLVVKNPGQSLVGELEFLDAPPASADVVLVQDADMIELDYAALAALMEKEPRLGYKLMREFAKIEAQRLRANNERQRTAAPEAGK